jgi:hypothetical protein
MHAVSDYWEWELNQPGNARYARGSTEADAWLVVESRSESMHPDTPMRPDTLRDESFRWLIISTVPHRHCASVGLKVHFPCAYRPSPQETSFLDPKRLAEAACDCYGLITKTQ